MQTMTAAEVRMDDLLDEVTTRQILKKRHQGPGYQAYQILTWGFTVLPFLAGLDKFFDLLVNWDKYLAPVIANNLPIETHTFMQGVGCVEMIAGLCVAVKPRLGGYIVSAWLLGIIVNLFLIPGYFDVALRDFGLSLGAFALAKLSSEFNP